MQEMRRDAELIVDDEQEAAGLPAEDAEAQAPQAEPSAQSEQPAQVEATVAKEEEPKRPPRGGRRPRAAAAEGSRDGDGAAKADPVGRSRRNVNPTPPPRLQVRYRDEIRGQLIRDFGYQSAMQAPEVKKVVLNVGLGEALTNAKALETVPGHLGAISGQKAMITKARLSVAGFKVREGQSIGAMVTLRGRRMYEFLDRMISMALPRIRDFRGVPRKSFDGKGNYSLGLREQIMFPEIDYGTVDKVRGLQVTITTSAQTDPEGFRLLELMGMPFARES